METGIFLNSVKCSVRIEFFDFEFVKMFQCTTRCCQIENIYCLHYLIENEEDRNKYFVE